jgi:ubiquitin-conjugating enzyme E2 J2
MATVAANKRLQREYKAISANPPPYITAHPSETNILEWHYLLTGPPQTPYEGGQYWGTLVFPSDYPFKPPAIRMVTPSGRFQTSTRLCLSISDFHPKSFNPAWEVSTILIGLLSFMTSEEMTTGSISASERERKVLAQSSRWWNSTGGGSAVRHEDGTIVHAGTVVPGRKVGLGDAGRRFRAEWPEVDAENWKWILAMKIDPLTGSIPAPANMRRQEVARRRVSQVLPSGGPAAGAAVVARGEGWLRRHRLFVGLLVVIGYVLLARALE